MALMTFLQQTTKIFLILLIQPWRVLHYMQMETSSLLSCSSAAPLDIDVVIQRERTLARNDLRHRMQRASLQHKLSTPRHADACELAVVHFAKECIICGTGPHQHHHDRLLLQEVASLSLSVSIENTALSSIDLNQIHEIDKVSNKTLLPINKMMHFAYLRRLHVNTITT
jgi:hypothetical protein